jgi:hypothetical protein
LSLEIWFMTQQLNFILMFSPDSRNVGSSHHLILIQPKWYQDNETAQRRLLEMLVTEEPSCSYFFLYWKSNYFKEIFDV